MSYLALFFMITSIVIIALIAWSYTKFGKSGLKNCRILSYGSLQWTIVFLCGWNNHRWKLSCLDLY